MSTGNDLNIPRRGQPMMHSASRKIVAGIGARCWFCALQRTTELLWGGIAYVARGTGSQDLAIPALIKPLSHDARTVNIEHRTR